MAEITLKSPHYKQRELDTHRLIAQVTVGVCVTEDIDIPGLSISACCTGATIVLSGFEADADVSLDSSRRAGFDIQAAGTAVGLTATEVGALNVTSAIVSGTAGSRIVTITLAAGAGAVDFSTDSLSDSVVEIILPIKSKDF